MAFTNTYYYMVGFSGESFDDYASRVLFVADWELNMDIQELQLAFVKDVEHLQWPPRPSPRLAERAIRKGQMTA